MKKYLALLKVSLSSILLASAGKGRSKKRRTTGIGVVALIAALGMYISGIYSGLLLTVLAPLGMEILVFIFMGIAALFSGLMFTAFGASSALYGGKDNDLLLSMPVSSSALMLARVSAIYLENLLFSFFLLVPAGVVCAFMTTTGAAQTLGFWLRILLAAVLLPLLDTALSVVIGAAIAWLSTKMTRKAIGQNLFMGVYMIVVFWFSFNLNSMIETLAVTAKTLMNSMKWATPILWMGKGILGDWGKLGLFALCCILPFAAMVIGLGKGYRKAVTAFASVSARSDYKLSAQRSAGQTRALLNKEAQRFFGTPGYFWNFGMGLMMLVAMGVLAYVKGDGLIQLLEMEEVTSLLLPILGAVVGFCLSMSPICAPSVSLEGKTLWLLKEAPVSERTILGVKLVFQWIVALPCILIGVPLLTAAFGLNAMDMLTLLIFSVLFETGLGFFGMLIGLYFAKPEASDQAIIKNSALSFISMFGPMVLLGLDGLLIWGVSTVASLSLGIAAAIALTAVFSAVSGVICARKGAKLFYHL